MPIIDPIIEVLKYDGCKRYKYFGDWSKEIRNQKKKNPMNTFDGFSSIRSDNMDFSEEI